nr:RCC1 domain-containing protein [Arthrobacter jiangjiafuii]
MFVPCSDLAPAKWIATSDEHWWNLVTLGPPGLPAHARLRFIPDPAYEGQSENDADTVGVTAGGRVLAVGDNSRGQCDTASWRDVVAVAGGSTHTLALRTDGSVLAAGNNDDGQCSTTGWMLSRGAVG